MICNQPATEGLAVRSYNEGMMYKGAHDLREGELPRKQYPFPEEPRCPHCGRTDRIVYRDTYFGCICGLHLYRPAEAMPLTPEMLIPEQVSGSLVNAVCDRCGKHFVKKIKNTSPYCQRCRSYLQSTEWMKAHPEQYRETQRKHQKLVKEKAARKRELAKDFF